MENEIIKASEFGVEEKQAKELTTGLDVTLSEREVLIKSYKSVIASDITEDNLDIFKELRLKIVKNRTQGIYKWHTASKAYFLAGGKFCDAIKNKESLVNTDMEAKLLAAETHFENLEKERIQKLHLERVELCKPHVEDESFILPDLGNMSESMWNNYILGLKTSSDARKEAAKKLEEEKIEKERVEKLSNERYMVLIPFADFFNTDEKEMILSDKLGSISVTDYISLSSKLKIKKSDYDKKQDKIATENKILKKEAEEKEQKAESERLERERLAKVESDNRERKEAELKLRNNKRNEELLPYIVFIRNYSTLLDTREKEYQEQFADIKKGAELQWESDRKEAEEKATNEEYERIERKRLADELKAKEEAEQKIKADEELRLQLELNKGDSDKVNDLISDLTVLKTKYTFKSAKNKKMYTDIGLLIDKVVTHIK